MKKKFIALLAGALLVAAMSGNAMASWTDGDLVRVVYNTTTNVEAIADLGSIASLEADSNGTVIGNGAASYLNNGITTASEAGSYVAYFAVSGTGNNSALYVSNDPSNAPAIAKSKMAGAGSALATLVHQSWSNATNYYQGTTTTAPSYYKTADASGGNVGSLDGFLNSGASSTEASLASVATQGIWFFNNANTNVTVPTLALTLQTNLDGTTTILSGGTTPVSSTPIPPAFFLMGSGLLGMFGMRRKKA